jgi:hypothetical protein
MTDSNVLQRAREGNPDAIAVLMNHSLKSKGMHAMVQRAGDRLLVNLETATPPDQALLTKFVNQGVQSLQLETIDTVIVAGRMKGSDRPAWTSTLHLKSNISQADGVQTNASHVSSPQAPPRYPAAPPPPPPLSHAGASAPIAPPPVPPAPEGQTIQAIDDESSSVIQESTQESIVDASERQGIGANAESSDAPRTTLQEDGAKTTFQETEESDDFRDGTVVVGLDDSSDQSAAALDAGHGTLASPMSPDAVEVDNLSSTADGMTTREADNTVPAKDVTESRATEGEQLRPLYEYDVYADETVASHETETEDFYSEHVESDADPDVGSDVESEPLGMESSGVESVNADTSDLSDLEDNPDAPMEAENQMAIASSMPNVAVMDDEGDAEDSHPNTPVPPSAPQPPPRRRSANPLVLVSVLIVTFGAVGGLIGYSLWSYFSNGGSILDPGIAPTPTMPEDPNEGDGANTDASGDEAENGDTASVDAEALLLEAEEKAESARTLAQTAQSGDDWDLVVRQWERAIALTETIPEGNSQFATAQQRLADYRTNLATAQQQAETLANVASAPLPSTVVTVNEEQVQCLDVAATADSQPVELTNVRFDTPSDEGTTNQIVGCITNHSDQAIASATIDYTGSSADEPDSTVEGRGELNFTDLEPGATVAFRGNFELPASLNTIEIGGISWLPVGSTESQSIETSLALTSN